MLANDDKNKAQLNIIGDGSYLGELQDLANGRDNIVFWGRKPREEIYKYLNASDFLIVSLIDKEIFSLTVPAKTQTYIAVGKPVLAILNGEAASLIKEYNLGFTAKPNDIEEIKDIFEKSINLSNEEKENFKKNSKELTNTIFHKEIIIDNLLKQLFK